MLICSWLNPRLTLLSKVNALHADHYKSESPCTLRLVSIPFPVPFLLIPSSSALRDSPPSQSGFMAAIKSVLTESPFDHACAASKNKSTLSLCLANIACRLLTQFYDLEFRPEAGCHKGTLAY